MKICFECNTVFESHFDIGLGLPCPILHCQGIVVDIDDNIFHTIKTLNEKRFRTEYCCSGHTWDGSPYISFDPIVRKDCFSFYPKGFVQEFTRSRLVIRKRIEIDEVLKKQKALNEAAYDLIEWSEKLPVAKMLLVTFNQDLRFKDINFVKMVEENLNLAFMDEVEIDGVSFFIYETATIPAHLKNLLKKIKSFAKKQQLKVDIDIN